MRNEILEVLTQSLAEERLDRIKMHDKSYQMALDQEIEAHDSLEVTLSEEQTGLLDEFVSATSKKAAALERIHYQQGLKDLYNLFQSLAVSDK